MNNSNYNSLTDNLIQNGIIQKETSNTDDALNIFSIKPDENMNNSPFVEKPFEESKNNFSQKRLNCYDLEMINNNSSDAFTNNTVKIVKRFIKTRENLASKGKLSIIEIFLFTFFPKLYKAKLAKDALSKLAELNIDTNKLHDKRIPYGEAEIRYQHLIKYLSYASEIQTKIKKKTF